MAGRVVVVGSVNVDLVVAAPRLPSAGETVAGGTFARHHGGKGGNQAVAAARLGAATAFVGAVGDDEFGQAARAGLEDAGVDVTGLTTVGRPTGVALIVVAPDGENLIAVASGANAALSAAHVRAAIGRLSISPADVVLVGHEIPTDTAVTALRSARAAGATAILNPAPADGLDATLCGLADIATPNRGELAALVGAEPGADPAGAAARLLADAAGLGAVFVSLGAAGGLLVRATGSPVVIEAPRVEAVDATGAGDALNGALAAGLAAGLDLPTAARRAVLAASLSTRTAGARDGMPTAAEVDAAGQ